MDVGSKKIIMRKNIEYNVQGIQCDNTNCDYVDENVKYGDYPEWLNRPCPECGENLLTEEDYNMLKAIINVAEMVNDMDFPEDDRKEEEMKKLTIDIHNKKIEISDIDKE